MLSGCFFMLFRVFSCFERYLVAHKGKQRSIAVFSGLERHTTEPAQQPVRHTTCPDIAPGFLRLPSRVFRGFPVDALI